METKENLINAIIDNENSFQLLKKKLDLKTRNIVGELTEKLLCQHFNGTLAQKNQKDYDFIASGKKYQVKFRSINSKGRIIVSIKNSTVDENRTGIMLLVYLTDGKIYFKEFRFGEINDKNGWKVNEKKGKITFRKKVNDIGGVVL